MKIIITILFTLFTLNANSTIISVSSDSGWFSERGYHSHLNTNAFTGQTESTLNGTAPSITEKFNSFLIFEIPTFNGAITSLALNIYTRHISGLLPEDKFEFAIYDVITDPQNFNSSYAAGSNTGLAIFDDLHSGEIYGTFDVKPWYLNEYLGVNLSGSAVSKANNSQGQLFAIGVSMTSAFRTSSETEGANFGVVAHTQSLLSELIIGIDGEDISSQIATPPPSEVSEPGSIALLAISLFGLMYTRKKIGRRSFKA